MHTVVTKLLQLMSGFVGITIAIFLIAGAAYLIPKFIAQKRLPTVAEIWNHYFPAEPWRTSNVRIDIFFYFAGKVTDKLFSVATAFIPAAIGGFIAAGASHIAPVHVTFKATFTATVALSAIFFLVTDFANYLTHLLQHKLPMLWEFHKVHHSSLFLTPLTTARMHPLGNEFDSLTAAILTSLPMGVAQYYFKLSVWEATAMLATANFIGTVVVLDPLRHSHFPVGFGALEKVLLSPHMHHLHHSTLRAHWDKNLGNKLSIWDWIFGTAFQPVKGEPIDFGVGTIEDARGDYGTLFGCYVGPFIKNYQMIERWTRGQSMTPEDKARLYTRNDDPGASANAGI